MPEEIWDLPEEEIEQQFVSPLPPIDLPKTKEDLTLQQFSDLMSDLFLSAKSLPFDRILALWDEFNFAILKLMSSRRKVCEASNPDLKVGETALPTWSDEEFNEVCRVFSKNPDGSKELTKVWRISHGNLATKKDGSPRLDGIGFSNEEDLLPTALPIESSFPQLQEFFELFGDLISGFRGILHAMKFSARSMSKDLLELDWYVSRDVRLFKSFLDKFNTGLLNILRGASRQENSLSLNGGKDCCPNRHKPHKHGRRRRQRINDHVISDCNEQKLDQFSHEMKISHSEFTPRCQSPPKGDNSDEKWTN